jgi:hypothetical protein
MTGANGVEYRHDPVQLLFGGEVVGSDCHGLSLLACPVVRVFRSLSGVVDLRIRSCGFY